MHPICNIITNQGMEQKDELNDKKRCCVETLWGCAGVTFGRGLKIFYFSNRRQKGGEIAILDVVQTIRKMKKTKNRLASHFTLL